MNEEQKQAIKELKHFTNMTVFWKEKEYTSHEIDNCINIVLHLIDEQQKEKERIEKKLKRYQKYLRDEKKKCEKLLEFEYTERERDYISKDKIKEKLEEIENSNTISISGLFDFLKELSGE